MYDGDHRESPVSKNMGTNSNVRKGSPDLLLLPNFSCRERMKREKKKSQSGADYDNAQAIQKQGRAHLKS